MLTAFIYAVQLRCRICAQSACLSDQLHWEAFPQLLAANGWAGSGCACRLAGRILCSQPQLTCHTGASAGLTSTCSGSQTFCPTSLNLCLLTPGQESHLQLAREPQCFPLCLLRQGDGRIQAGKVGGGSSSEQLGPPQARAAATGLGQRLKREEEEMSWWGAAGESRPASCSNTSTAACSALLFPVWKCWDLKEYFTPRGELQLQFGGVGVHARG